MKTLILGIGNPGRGDDGLGAAIVARAAGLNVRDLVEGAVVFVSPERDAVWKYQLNIEDADLIRGYDRVVFADAAAEGGEPVVWAEVAASPSIAFTTHEMAPASVLALCEELGGRAPRAFLLAVRGYEWEFSESLSPAGALNLEKATALLAKRLEAADTD